MGWVRITPEEMEGRYTIVSALVVINCLCGETIGIKNPNQNKQYECSKCGRLYYLMLTLVGMER